MQCFRSEEVLTEHKGNCLIINGKQNVKLGKGLISFKKYSKKLPAPSKGVKYSDKSNGSYTEKYQDHILCSIAYKVVSVDNKFSKDVVLYRGKNSA